MPNTSSQFLLGQVHAFDVIVGIVVIISTMFIAINRIIALIDITS